MIGKGTAAVSRARKASGEAPDSAAGKAPAGPRGSKPRKASKVAPASSSEHAELGAVDGLMPSDDPTRPDFGWAAIEHVRPWVRNPRKNARAVGKVADSIRAFGWGRPLVVNEWPGCEGELIVGHTAWLAAHELKLDMVPVRYRRMEPSAAHALAIADNKLGEISDWDPDELGRIVGEGELSSAQLQIAGFSEAELRRLRGDSSETGEDDVPAPPAEPITRPGDLWILGKHRLVCGDSSDVAVIEQLLDGTTPDLTLTDPPYGIARVWKGGSELHGWKKSNRQMAARNAWDREAPPIDVLLSHTKRAKQAIVWGGNYFPLPPSRGWLVWTKPERGFSLSEAELAWTSRDMPIRVFDGARSDAGREHPTQKTVAVMAWCLDLFKRPKHIFDPYGGAGTTLIAAEQIGRAAYIVEREPGWCDVTIERWKKQTGGAPERVTREAA